MYSMYILSADGPGLWNLFDLPGRKEVHLDQDVVVATVETKLRLDEGNKLTCT